MADRSPSRLQGSSPHRLHSSGACALGKEFARNGPKLRGTPHVPPTPQARTQTGTWVRWGRAVTPGACARAAASRTSSGEGTQK